MTARSPSALLDVSVVVPARNAAGVIGEQLDALAAQRFDGTWEVVVVDDRSTDETAAVVERYRDRLPGLRVVETDVNRNAAHARNVGIAVARGRYLLFCDADDVVGDGWLAALTGVLADTRVVAGRSDIGLLNPPWVQASRPVPQQHGLQVWGDDHRPWLPHAGTGNLGVPRAVLDAIGTFDAALDFNEAPDFCFRAQLAGYELRFVPDAVVHIRLRATLPGVYRQIRDWAESSVVLERRFAAAGMPQRSALRGLLAWGLVLPRLLGVRDRAGLARWLHLLGWRVGRLRGSLRYRTMAL